MINEIQTREERAKSMVLDGVEPKILDENVFVVPSQTTEQRYKVLQHYNGWTCTCADYKHRHLIVGECKHILYIKFWKEYKDTLFSSGAFESLENIYGKPSCPHCGSLEIKKNGVRKNKGEPKQRFKCLTCADTFIQNPEFRGLKGQAKTVTACMDLYFKGCSLRKIQDHLLQFYGVRVNHETIRRWINKYMAHIRNFIDKIQPQVSRKWHVDEMKYKNKQEWNWVWNVMDSDTRFLLATNTTDSRYKKDARKVFQEAKNVTPFQPETIVSDGLQSYKHAVEKEFRTLRNRNTQHVWHAGIQSRIHNNKIERFHGTLRERLKVQRGLQNHKTTAQNMENFRAYYNYLRPHQGLNGKTPAQKAGIMLPNYGNKNKWLSLLKKSM